KREVVALLLGVPPPWVPVGGNGNVEANWHLFDDDLHCLYCIAFGLGMVFMRRGRNSGICLMGHPSELHCIEFYTAIRKGNIAFSVGIS
ncbi:hypothetical protein CEXT_152601, partial [Caerostris extrusa]